MRAQLINGQPGFVVKLSDGLVCALALETDEQLITAIYVMGNPDKLQHIPP
jgi:RNA polymerase sigma-70 factor, ECF subfamily